MLARSLYSSWGSTRPCHHSQWSKLSHQHLTYELLPGEMYMCIFTYICKCKCICICACLHTLAQVYTRAPCISTDIKLKPPMASGRLNILGSRWQSCVWYCNRGCTWLLHTQLRSVVKQEPLRNTRASNTKTFWKNQLQGVLSMCGMGLHHIRLDMRGATRLAAFKTLIEPLATS